MPKSLAPLVIRTGTDGSTPPTGFVELYSNGTSLNMRNDAGSLMIIEPRPRSSSITSATSQTINAQFTDQYNITALASNITISISGTLISGQNLVVRIKDNGTTRTLTWPASLRAIGVTIPTATVASKTLYVGMKWNEADSKWDVLAVGQEA